MTEIKIRKSTLYIAGIILLILAGSFFMLKNKDIGVGENIINKNSDSNVQKLIIGMKNYNYYPNNVKVKAGIPVSISLDESVFGCFRDFTIREFGIRKYLRTAKDTVDFIPTKPGKYTFACGMGMGVGTLIVE